MARNPEITKRRNAEIVKEYDRLRSIRVGRARKYTPDYCITQLAEKFFLSERTIEDIVWKKRD
ncbi:MAG: hypothetical protein JNJ91_05245 [Flavobacteriales bacterium]|nr:hypothetical protein [Flavobacteriales bacterium]